MEKVREQIQIQKQMLKCGQSSYDPITLKNSAALFRECCLSACSKFSVNESNRELMNELFLCIPSGPEQNRYRSLSP